VSTTIRTAAAVRALAPALAAAALALSLLFATAGRHSTLGEGTPMPALHCGCLTP